MPVYEFSCAECGPFEERRSFDEVGESVSCPKCGTAARRVYSMPNTKRMPAGLSRAMSRAEKSAHEPETVRRQVGGDGRKHNHVHQGRPWTVGH